MMRYPIKITPPTTLTELYERIDAGMILVVPKELYKDAALISDQKAYVVFTLVDRELAKQALSAEEMPMVNKLVRIPEEDLIMGDLIKKGWRSMGWKGKNNDYFRGVKLP